MTGSAHPAYTLSALCIIGGSVGFLRAKSLPSLVGGLSLGSIYGWSGYRISNGQKYGYECATLASSLLILAGLRRFKTSNVPKFLTATGSIGTIYYGKQVNDYGFGN
ncbi:hypothetical protein O181_029642 [Austropuccinia psidii MF-1]|uniref:Transmembrane protein 14C n=1 Tax=Austropuccinia psidii MF-1 TaxID=1389203 RepID=A0A9Q3H3P8_9BASI|nr:hypothetical protein [Austropuccinia psidii MF-1]